MKRRSRQDLDAEALQERGAPSWPDILRSLGLDTDTVVLLAASSDVGRRVYLGDCSVHKIVCRSLTTTQGIRQRTLEQEYRLLVPLQSVPGVPQLLGFKQSPLADMLTMEPVDAVPWTQLVRIRHAVQGFARLMILILQLSRRRVVHGDLRLENVLIDRAGRPWLVDFDQAQQSSIPRALLGNFGGIQSGDLVVHFGVLQFTKRWLSSVLMRPAMNALRRAKRWLTGRSAPVVARLAPLPKHASPRLRLLHEAWRLGAASNANAPGLGVCYYELSLEGFHLPGERPWSTRWEMFSRAVSWTDSRVLELGCNMGLLGTFALRQGAQAVLGVDSDPEILSANGLVQEAFSVRYPTVVCDFDGPGAWEDELSAFRPTIVSALSVLNWVTDKDRFLRFLGRFEIVLFEGHDPTEVEISRLRAAGFRDVEVLGSSERERPVLMARRG